MTCMMPRRLSYIRSTMLTRRRPSRCSVRTGACGWRPRALAKIGAPEGIRTPDPQIRPYRRRRHDFCGMDHALLGGRRLALGGQLPGMSGRADGVGRAMRLHGRHHPADIADIGRADHRAAPGVHRLDTALMTFRSTEVSVIRAAPCPAGGGNGIKLIKVIKIIIPAG